jgi:hypothetical protein
VVCTVPDHADAIVGRIDAEREVARIRGLVTAPACLSTMDRLAAGESQADIARADNVLDSAVTQRMKKIRELAGAAA